MSCHILSTESGEIDFRWKLCFPFQRGTHANGSFRVSSQAVHTSGTSVVPLRGKHLNGPIYSSNENEPRLILCPADMVELSSIQLNRPTPQTRWYLQTVFWEPPLVYVTLWSLLKHPLEDSFLAQVKGTPETVLTNNMDNHVAMPGPMPALIILLVEMEPMYLALII